MDWESENGYSVVLGAAGAELHTGVCVCTLLPLSSLGGTSPGMLTGPRADEGKDCLCLVTGMWLFRACESSGLRGYTEVYIGVTEQSDSDSLRNLSC